jgi:putative SOS response-associated peptidase YedK
MCGRYDNLIAQDAYRGLFKAQRLAQSNFPPRYNIAPTDQSPSSASILATANES